jgi:hypothetical protein
MLSFNDTKNWVATKARKVSEQTSPRSASVGCSSDRSTMAKAPLRQEFSAAIDDISGLPGAARLPEIISIH